MKGDQTTRRWRLWAGAAVLVVTLVLMSILVWSGPVLASQLSLEATHYFTVSLIYEGDGSSVSPTRGRISADTYGEAGNVKAPPDEKNIANEYKEIFYGTPDTATASFDPMTWLQTNTASTTYEGATSFTLSHKLMAYGPTPSNITSYDYYVYQSARVYFDLYFTAPYAGSYTATLTDIYDIAYRLIQGSGSGCPFYQTYVASYIHGNVGGSPSPGDVNLNKFPLKELRDNYPYPLPNISLERYNKQVSVTLFLDDVVEGETFYFHGDVMDYQRGSTVVPLPGSVLLLGTGLLGLGLLGCRRRKS